MDIITFPRNPRSNPSMSTPPYRDLPLVNPIALTPKIAKRIQSRIDALHPDRFRSSGTYELKHVYNALPIASNLNFIWAIRPNGEVLCLDHESFSLQCERETDPLRVHAAMARGALSYVELRTVRPPPPKRTKRCFTCSSEGYKIDDKGHAESCLTCSGVGWLWRD